MIVSNIVDQISLPLGVLRWDLAPEKSPEVLSGQFRSQRMHPVSAGVWATLSVRRGFLCSSIWDVSVRSPPAACRAVLGEGVYHIAVGCRGLQMCVLCICTQYPVHAVNGRQTLKYIHEKQEYHQSASIIKSARQMSV